MGKGQIIAHKGDGLYDVRLTYAYRDRITARLATYTVQIAELDVKIAAETDASKKAILKLQRASIQKLYDYYSTKMPADPTVEAWCADLTEDLAYGTIVGTAEIPGEQVTVLVRPGYNGRSIYSAARDGQLMPSIAGSPHQVLFNWMLLPGWQRHKPIYRTGTISAIDYDANTCTVCVEPAFSSQQNLPAVDGVSVADCGATALAGAADFCSRYPTHPFCTNSDEGSEIELTTGQLAQLQLVNQDINLNYGRQGDPSGYRTGDSWDVMAPGGSGDCEDFALTKMQALVDTYGWSPANLKLVTGYTKTGEYHAMLGVRTSNYGLMILDVNNDPVVASTKLPYRIDKIAMTATSWKNYTRQLAAVPVEYMSCNAAAFAPGDSVVVEFTGQSWTTPKVVGFLENPQACTFDALVLGNSSFTSSDWSFWKYLYNTSAWTYLLGLGDIPGNEYYAPEGWIIRSLMFAVSSGSTAYLFGGVDSVSYIYDPDETTPIPECDAYPGCKPDMYDRADKLNLATNVFSALQAMPDGKGYGSGFRIGAKCYCVAGARYTWEWLFQETEPQTSIVQSGGPVADNLEYGELADSWASKTPCGSARIYSRDFVLSGKGFSFGGLTTHTPSPPEDWVFSHSMSGYDPVTDSWAAYQDMSRGRYRFGAATMLEEGYVFGSLVDAAHGSDVAQSYGWYATNWLEKFNVTSNTWAYVQELYDDPATVLHSGGVAAQGGANCMGFIKTWSEYDASIATRTQMTQPPPRSAFYNSPDSFSTVAA